MKKILVVAIALIASVSSYSQNKISGFGKLQLGMPISEISELSSAKVINNTSEYFTKVYENKTKNVYEAKLDSNVTSSFNTFSPRVRIFQVGQMNLTENIVVTDVVLSFFDDKLYSIKVGDGKIDELLTTKYGSPKEEITTKDNTFQNGYGAKFVKTDIKKEHTWNTNDPQTSCYYVNNFWYNDSGKLLHVEYCYLTNNKIDQLVNEENKKVIVRMKKREEESKKEMTKGF